MWTWLETVGPFVLIMIVWDCVRLFLQALVNKWMLKKDFKNIEDAVEDLEEDVEEAMEEDFSENANKNDSSN